MKALRPQLILVVMVVTGLAIAADPLRSVFRQRVPLVTGGPFVEVNVDAGARIAITTASGALALNLGADSWAGLDEPDIPSWDPTALEFVDVTFDGLADLKVLVARGAYNDVYQFWAWSPAGQTFRPIAGLEAVTNPELDLKSRTLVSFHKGRAYGDLWVRREFQWSGIAWVATEETERQMVDENVEGSGYLLIHRRLQKGAWVEDSREPSEDDPTSPP